MKRLVFLLLCVLSCLPLLAEVNPALPPSFDPSRHMLIREVKPGMKGYGLSVFSGKKIERFDVEVISILRHFNPRQDVILIRATGCNLEHTGAIAGMSGSPIYLQDDAGRSRMIGAFAYGWPLMKDPLAGVQPIEYMLSIPLYQNVKPQGATVAGALPVGSWSVLDSMTQTRIRLQNQIAPDAKHLSLQLRPLGTPLSASGIASTQLQQLGSLFDPFGMVPLQAGGSAASNAPPSPIEPGSVLAVPLLTGDVDLTAVGTCTEVINGNVYGFGHPFTGEGPVSLPMCGGEINGVIANLMTSFKLGAATAAQGALVADHASGVAGRLGMSPPTAPIKFHVRYSDKSLDQTYSFNAAIHPRFTPLLASVAMFSSLSGSRELPQHNTINYRLAVDFLDGHSIQLANTLCDVEPNMLFFEIASALSAATDNPFQRVLLKGITGDIEVREGSTEAQILHATAPRLVYKPGETVRFFVNVRPFRAVEIAQPLDFALPSDLADGSYELTVSDVSRFILEEHMASPYRFTAGNIDQVFTALNELTRYRSDIYYLRLSQTETGVALGRNALLKIPASQRQMLLATCRSDITPFSVSLVRQVPSKWVLGGSAQLTITVSRDPRQMRKATGAGGVNAMPPKMSMPITMPMPSLP